LDIRLLMKDLTMSLKLILLEQFTNLKYWEAEEFNTITMEINVLFMDIAKVMESLIIKSQNR
jgi:hypothetical protein